MYRIMSISINVVTSLLFVSLSLGLKVYEYNGQITELCGVPIARCITKPGPKIKINTIQFGL